MLLSLLCKSQRWDTNYVSGAFFINDIFFTSETRGYAVGSAPYSFMYTNNAGLNWTEVSSSDDLADIYFVGDSIGYIVGENGHIQKTTDGGANWDTLTSGSTDFLKAACFVTKDTGYIVGYNPSNFVVSVIKTTNGGNTWNQTGPLGTNNTVWDIYFLNSRHGFITGMGGSKLWTTTDGGSTWSQQFLPGGTGVMQIEFINDSTAIAVGNEGKIWRTTDTAKSWITLPSYTTEHLLDVKFITDSTGYIAGYNGTILKTNDIGLTWKADTVNSGVNLFSICMVNKKHGWSAGNLGYAGAVILQFGNPSGIDNYYYQANNLYIFPNPATDKLTVIASEAKQSEISIYNIQGQTLIQQALQKTKTDIDISALPKAMYILKIENTDGVWVKKFVKE